MEKLMCSAGNCVNNVSGLCSANKIHVGGMNADSANETDCETFAEKGIRNAIVNLGNFNLAGSFKQRLNKDEVEMSPHIKCEATNCIHNNNNLCIAQNVQIYGPEARTNQGTQCQTFVE